MRFRNPAIPALTLAVALLAGIPAARAQTNPRLDAARAELEEARAALQEVTTPRESEIWERRIKILEQEIQNIERMAELEKKERAVAATQTKSDHELLLEALAAVSTERADLERRRTDVDGAMKDLVAQRQRLEERAKQTTPVSDEDFDRLAETEEQIKNVDEEILARRLQREACDLELRLRADAVAGREAVARCEAVPEPTLRLLLAKRRTIVDVRDKRAFYHGRRTSLEDAKEQLAGRLALMKERSTHVASEYETLRDKYAIERRTTTGAATPEERQNRLRRLARVLGTLKSEMRMLQPRIGFLEEQLAAMDGQITTCQQGEALTEHELAYLEGDYREIKKQHLGKITLLGAVVLGIILIAILFENLVLPHTVKRENLFVSRRLSRYLAGLLVIIAATVFFFEDLRAVATILGLATAAAVIALQDLCSSFVGWFVIALNRKIRVGDHVEVDGIVGDIIDIQILRTTVRECRGWLSSDDHTGRVVFIPNNFIFKHHLFNYSYVHPNVWQQMEVTVTFETPVEETRELLLKILREETRDDLQEFNEGETRFGHRYNLETAPKEPKMHVIIADSGVLFRMFFPAHYGQVSGTRSRISQRILAEFAQRPRIQFAYPTQRHIPTAEADGFKVQVLNPAR